MLSLFNKDNIVNSIYKQYAHFFVIGIFCFLIDFSILYLLKEHANINLYLAVSIAFIIATYINYLLNIKLVFVGGKHTKQKEMLLFFIVANGGILLSLLIIFVLVDLILLNYLISKVIAVFLVSIYSFLMRKFIVFYK